MRTMRRSVSALTLATILFTPLVVQAQTLIDGEATATCLNQYIENPYGDYDSAWWESLQAELMPFTSLPVAQVQLAQLQNVIFFALNHAEKVDMKRAGPQLYNVYMHHPDDGFRIVALTALHAVESDAELFKLFGEVDKESSPRVKRHMTRVLKDYFTYQYDTNSIHAQTQSRLMEGQ